MPDDRLNMRLDIKTLARLKALEEDMELKRPDIIKQAVRLLAEQRGLEGQSAPPTPPAAET
jgi:hypothetical protein